MALIFNNPTSVRAQFRLRQAEGLTGVFLVEPRGSVVLDLEARYVLRVSGRMDGVRYESSLELERPCEHVLIARRQGEGHAPFELLREAARADPGLTCENVLPARLAVRLSRSRPPLSGLVLLEQWQSHRFALADVFDVFAILDGYLTEPLRLEGPDHELAVTRLRDTGVYGLRPVD